LEPEHLYSEKIFDKIIAGILISVSIVMIFLFIYFTLTLDPGSELIIVQWVFLGVGIVMLFLALNFGILSIKISPQSVVLRYGIIKNEIKLDDVEDCHHDSRLGIRYGGWGLRAIRSRGKWVKGYILVRVPKIILSLKEGKFKEVAISTRNPDKILQIIKEQIGN